MFHYKLALRYLKGRHKILFSFSNLLSLGGIVIGVFSLLVVSSVMNGFNSDMRRRVIGSKAQIKIHRADYSPMTNYQTVVDKITEQEKILAAAPVCESELMIQKGQNLAASICFGIDFNRHQKITEIFRKIVVGVPEQADLENNGIIIGLELSLSLNATVGEYITVMSPLGTEPSPFGLLPRSRKLKVVGIFSSGMPEYDRVYTYISLQNAQFFMGLDSSVTQIEVKTTNPASSYAISRRLQSLLGKEFIVEDWSEFDANLFNAMKMEKLVMFLVLALMIIIASFNVTGNFIRLITEKKAEIGILKAMGASDRDIIRIFLTAGLLIGIIGSLIGLTSSFLLLWAQQRWQFIVIPVPGFPLQWLPVELRWQDFLAVFVLALIISIVTILHPAHRTVKFNPIKMIRDN